VSALALAVLLAYAGPVAQGSYATVNGLRMYYEERGHGRPLVLLHGGGSTVATSFGVIMPKLAQGHRIIAPEQQGHGHTADIDRPLSFEQMADDTAALLERLGVRDADVLAFSNGSMTALRLALRHPELVRRLVLCSGFYAHAGLAPELRQAFERPPDPAAMPPALRDAYVAVAPHPEALATLVTKTVAMMRGFADLTPADLRRIQAPVLVIDGDRDVVLPEHALQLARLVPHGEVAVMPGSAHGAYIGTAESAVPGSRLPAVTLELIEGFLGGR